MNTIDVNRTEKKGEEKTFSIGQMFLKPNGELYILAQVAPSSIALINLENGNRLDEMCDVENICKVTVGELICYDENFPDYKAVDTKITVNI